MLCSWREKVTKVRLTAFSISSMHMSTISTLRRMSTPVSPMKKMIEQNDRTIQGSICSNLASRDAFDFLEPAQLALGDGHRAHDPREQEQRGQLEGQDVLREHELRDH